MDNQTIAPALTPEEWKATRRYPPGVVYGFDDGQEAGTMSRHRMAAMCLYNQPFGFTQEDVKALLESSENDHAAYLHHNTLLSIANRIAALLPPQDSSNAWLDSLEGKDG